MRLRYQQKLSRRRGGRFDPGARLDKAFKNRVRRERWKISPLVGRGGEVQDTTSATWMDQMNPQCLKREAGF